MPCTAMHQNNLLNSKCVCVCLAGGSNLKSNIPGAISAFSAGLSPAEEEEQERARQAAFKQVGVCEQTSRDSLQVV